MQRIEPLIPTIRIRYTSISCKREEFYSALKLGLSFRFQEFGHRDPRAVVGVFDLDVVHEAFDQL